MLVYGHRRDGFSSRIDITLGRGTRSRLAWSNWANHWRCRGSWIFVGVLLRHEFGFLKRMDKNAINNRRSFIHSLVWVWAGVVFLLPWVLVAAGWFFVYLILINFLAGTAAVCATRWWVLHRRSSEPPAS